MKYKIKAEQAKYFINDFNLTRNFDRWKTNIIKGYISLRDKFVATGPESSGVRERSKDSKPTDVSGGRVQSQVPSPTPNRSEDVESCSGDS